MELLVPDLCDAGRYSREEALRLAEERCRERPSYDLQISQFLNQYLNSRKIDLPIIERAMDILNKIAPAARLLSTLRLAMTNNDPQIRSKSVLLLGRKIEGLPLLQKLTMDDDPRVRANAIEALWGRQTPDIEAIFLQAVKDPHPRVAGNAIYGLYLIDPEKHLANLSALAEHAQPGQRGAAAWIIGKIGDTRNVAILKPLLSDANPAVRRAAFRAVTTLRVKASSTEEVAVSH